MQFHDLRPGVVVPAAVWEGGRGRATVLAYAPDEVRVQISLTLPPLPRLPITLLVGVCRPQTLKKVVQAGALLGVREVVFFGSELGERSYFSSKELRPERLRLEMVKALEQAHDSVPLRVVTAPSLESAMHPWREPVGRVALYGETAADGVPLAHLRIPSPLVEIVVVIGPEAGLSIGERTVLRGQGFQPVSFGPRVLRVETAVASLVAGVTLLRELGG
jgi:RsmE family RNA methyltransferase